MEYPMSDYDDSYDTWMKKDHARRTDKRVGEIVPAVNFKVRVRDESIEGPNPYRWGNLSSYEIFGGKRVILFSLPGAFTPTCSNYQLPNFEKMYDDFKARGIDEIYCISVNDAFVMNAWAKQQGIEKVKMLPDGNAEFTQKLGMLVDKTNLGFGDRSWRYAAIVFDGKIRGWFEEPGFDNKCETDPYGESSPENIIKFLEA
jgi:peroxiredoxin